MADADTDKVDAAPETPQAKPTAKIKKHPRCWLVQDYVGRRNIKLSILGASTNAAGTLRHGPIHVVTGKLTSDELVAAIDSAKHREGAFSVVILGLDGVLVIPLNSY